MRSSGNTSAKGKPGCCKNEVSTAPKRHGTEPVDVQNDTRPSLVAMVCHLAKEGLVRANHSPRKHSSPRAIARTQKIHREIDVLVGRPRPGSAPRRASPP